MHSPRKIERAGAVDSRMRTRPSSLTPTAALSGIWGLLLIAFVVAALYFGRSVFVPIALATLITFLLSRLVTRLERWIGRIAAVLVTVIAMFTIFAGASWVIGSQVIDLADKLPDYQANIVAKIRSLRLPAGGPLARFSSSVHVLQNELVAPSPAPSTDRARGDSSTRTPPPVASPIPVKVIEGRSAIPQLMQETLSAILSPLGTAALVLLLVIFMLLKREDLRGRLIRLVGQGRISTTTRAMEDAGRRVSRYLSTQFLVNTCYGICVAFGLQFIGVPNAALWGVLAGVLRFIPYVGAMGWRSLAGATLVCNLEQLVHAADDDRFVHCVRGDRIKLCRALGLRCEHGRFADCVNHFGSVLDLALGSGWSRAFYSYDSVFGGDRATCSAARVSGDFAKRRSSTGAS